MSNLSYEQMQARSGISATQRPGRTRWIKRVSWASVFAGVAVALGVQVLLSMLGTGIGMSTVDPLSAEGTPSASAFSVGAGLWWVVSSFISLVIGGWVAAQFSGYLRHLDGLLHGLLVWAVTTLFTIYLLGSAISSIVSGAGTVLSAGARGMAESTSSALLRDDIREDAMVLLSNQPGAGSQQAIDPMTGMPIPARPRSSVMDPEFSMALERFLTAEDEDTRISNRTTLINLLVTRTGMSMDEAANRVDTWSSAYQQAEQRAREAADSTAKAVSWSALWGFIVILLSAIAGALGGIAGTPIPDEEYPEEV
ncbi:MULTISPECIES: hypothetical protein [Methylobacter]|jgi:hypothetical protein|uniref:hypothetical protein n=1 Tax=Methylobacter TaxID=429 RepID=UPI0004834D81|nr:MULTISPECIES: hypothetical protein [Methylobacter]